MSEKMYYTAAEVAEMLGVSLGKSYRILRQLNEQLDAKGYLTIPGKVPAEYFREKWYGAEKIGMTGPMAHTPSAKSPVRISLRAASANADASEEKDGAA